MNATTSTPIASTCGCSNSCASDEKAPRSGAIGRALRLEYLTVGWNLVEGVIAVTAALLASSVAILGFGMDSFVECASAGVMIWRLRAERARSMSQEEIEVIERRAQRLVAESLLALATYVSFDAVQTLWKAERPSFSASGVALLLLSIVVMLWLARAKRRLASELGSRAMEADAFQTTACWWLSIAALIGVALNGWLGWWWADPVAALVIAGLILREGREAWNGRACC